MAKIQTLNVGGMSIEDIRGLDTRTLSNRALKQALARLVSAGNKRLRRLQADQLGQYSPTAKTRAFSGQGLKTRGEIKAEYDRVRAFLDPAKKSHTVKGWKQITKRMEQKGVPKNQITNPNFWGLFRKFSAEMVPALYDSYTLLTLIAGLVNDGRTENEIHEYLINGGDYDESDDFGEFEDAFGDYYE